MPRMHLKNGKSNGNSAYAWKRPISKVTGRPKVSF
jgi:hypothetical protein